MKKFVLLFLIFSCVCFSCSNDTKKKTKNYVSDDSGSPSRPGDNQNVTIQGVFSGDRSGTWTGSLQNGIFKATFKVDEATFDVNGTLDRTNKLTAVGSSVQWSGSSITLEGAISGGKDINGRYTLKREQGRNVSSYSYSGNGSVYNGSFTGRIVKN